MQTSHQQQDSQLFLPLALCLGAFVRLLGVRARPIWYDEAFAIIFSGKGLAAMLAGTLTPDANGAAADIHPLGYYTLLWGWMRAFGDSVVSVRLLSILFGLGTIALAWALMKALFADSGLAGWGALAVALSPFQVHFSQEIRMYALLGFLLTGAAFALWRGLNDSGWGWWFLFGLCAALAQYVHNLAAFTLLPLALTPFFTAQREKIRAILLAGAGALILYLPWLFPLASQIIKVRSYYWVYRPGLTEIIKTLLYYVTNLPLAAVWLPFALTGSLLLIVLAAYQTWCALRAKQPGARRGLWLAYLAFAPAMLMFLVSQIQPVYIERALLPSGVTFCLWLAWALFDVDCPRPARGLMTGIFLAASVLGIATHLSSVRIVPAETMLNNLNADLRPGDVIVHSDKLSLLPMLYYAPQLPQEFVGDEPGSPSDTLAPATQRVLGISAHLNLESAVGDAKRVWFVLLNQDLQEYLQAGLKTHPHLAWLDERYRLVETRVWDGVLFYLYEQY